MDLGGIFDLAGLRPAGMAQDGVAGFNTHTIALEIPTTKLAVPVSDGVNANDKTFLTEFPFLALPWRGSDEGHGSPAP